MHGDADAVCCICAESPTHSNDSNQEDVGSTRPGGNDHKQPRGTAW